MKNYDFDWQINEFMVYEFMLYCRCTQLREKTMSMDKASAQTQKKSTQSR